MKKIIAMITLLTITMGCGKTAKLERDRLEAAQEQARLAAEAEQLRYKGVLERFSTHAWNNKGSYGIGAVIAISSFVGLPILYHYCTYKKPDLEDDPIPYDAKQAADDFYKDNPGLTPTPAEGSKPKPPMKIKSKENGKESSSTKAEPKVLAADNTSDEEYIPITPPIPKPKKKVVEREPPIKIDTDEEHKKRMDDGRKLREETDRLIAEVNKRIPAARKNAE